MKQRALSTIGLWLVVGLMLAGFNAFGQVKLGGFLLIALLGLGAQYEVYAILRQTGATPRSASGLTAGALFLTALFMGWVTLPPAVPWVALAWVAVLLSLLARPLQNHEWVLRLSTLFGVLYVPFLLGFLVILASEPQGLWAALWVVVATKFTDVGGLLIGVPFGKHKIAPNVSPAKSVEGCIGGILLSAAVSALVAWGYHYADPIKFKDFLTPAQAALYALPIAALSIPSDLVESYLKRRGGVKDSGSTIPGIGGALDLVDSLLLVAPVAYLLLKVA
jgi:phosphatidate cytidylyltransferase